MAIAVAFAVAVATATVAIFIRVPHNRYPFPLLSYKLPPPTALKNPSPSNSIARAITVAISSVRATVSTYYLAVFAMPIEVGDEFVDFKSFNAAMSDWSISGEHKFRLP